MKYSLLQLRKKRWLPPYLVIMVNEGWTNRHRSYFAVLVVFLGNLIGSIEITAPSITASDKLTTSSTQDGHVHCPVMRCDAFLCRPTRHFSIGPIAVTLCRARDAEYFSPASCVTLIEF